MINNQQIKNPNLKKTDCQFCGGNSFHLKAPFEYVVRYCDKCGVGEVLKPDEAAPILTARAAKKESNNVPVTPK